MNIDLLSFETAINGQLQDNRLDPVLDAVRALATAVSQDVATHGTVLGSAVLDGICQRIGKISLDYLKQENILPPVASQPADAIFLTTNLYGTNGYAAIIEQIVRGKPGKRYLVLETGFLANSPVASTASLDALEVQQRRPADGSPVDQLVWMQLQLACHPGAQVFVFSQPADTGAIAAIQPGLNSEVIFCHPGDNQLRLGATLSWVRHAVEIPNTRENGALAAYLQRTPLHAESIPAIAALFTTPGQTAPAAHDADTAALLARGRKFLDAGQLIDANETLQQALQAAPANPFVLFELGRLAFAASMPEDGINIFSEAVQSVAVLPQILQFGEALVSQGKTGEGQMVLSFARKSVAKHRPAGNPADGLARIRALTDNEWSDLLCRSHEEPDYYGFKLPGFPQAEFQINTMGSSNENAMREAFYFYRAVLPFINRMRPLQERTLLDFGTGWGRFARTFVKAFEPHNIWGSDVDPVMIKTCTDNFNFGNFLVTPAFPPTELESNKFDLITAYSVFSHLSEEAANAWMKEFSRILRPGGFVAFTTQGRDFIAQCAYFRKQQQFTNPWHKQLAVSFVDEAACYADYDAGKLLFAPTGAGSSEVRPSSFYGEALIPVTYMIRNWNDMFDIQTFIDDRAIMPQAFTILRKK